MSLDSLKRILAPVAWNFLRSTVRVEADEAAAHLPGGPVIFACLHRDILPAILFVRSRKPVLLVSTSPDGEILIRALGRVDYDFVRGQSGREGARALVELRRFLEAGRSLGVAVDGPKGPFGEIQPGVLQLAQLSGASILPLRAEADHGINLDTWDRTLVPRPFSRVRMICGPVLNLSSDSTDGDREASLEQLADFFRLEGSVDADR